MLAAGIVDVETAAGFDGELREATAFLDAEWLEKAAAAGVDAEAALQYFRGEVRRESERLAAPRPAAEVPGDEAETAR